jgi:hypothetical protein
MTLFGIALIVIVLFLAGRRFTDRGASLRPIIGVGLLVVVVLFLIVGRGSGGGDGGASSGPPSVLVVEPLDATRVASPVTVTIETERMGAGHLHVVVDQPCIRAGRVIPTDAAHRHLERVARSADVELAPGPHRVCVQIGDASHRATEANAEVRFIVAGE